MSANAVAMNYLEQLASGQFWGFITLKFERGVVVHVRREENLKPAELPMLPGKNRGHVDAEREH